ncbi:MAG TPA: MFS transporter [Thermoanaerobaculia bacterium]
MNVWKSLRRLPKGVWVISGAFLVNRAGSMILAFLVLYATRDLGLTAERAGLAVTAFGLGSLLAAPFAGRLADRFPPLSIMQTSLVVGGLLAVLLPTARAFVPLVAGVLLWASVSEAYRAPSLAIIGEITPPEQLKPAFSLVRLAANLGLSIGPVIGGLLAERSFPAIFVVDGTTSVLAGIILIVLAGRMGLPKRTVRVGDDVRPPWAALRDRDFVLFVAAMVPILAVVFQCLSAMSLYVVRDLGVPPSGYGLLLAINTVLIVILDLPINAATARWPHRRALLFGSALIAFGFGALAFARTPVAVAATIVVWTFGEIFTFGALNALAVELAPPARRGEYMGLYQMAFSLAFVAGPALGVFVLERLGPAALWSGCFAVALLSGAFLAKVRSPEPRTVSFQ